MMLADRHKAIRRGVTLVELLIVISIITLLAAIALPAMQTGMESRRMREAARAFHVYLGSAQVHAAELGRPVGVMLERSAIDPRACTLVRQVEIPPPYAGDFDGADLQVRVVAPRTLQVRFNYGMFPLSSGLISPGNRVQLNYQGTYYVIQPPNGITDFPVDANGYFDFSVLTDTNPAPDGWADETLTLVVDGNLAVNLPWPVNPGWTVATFQIIRDPLPSAVAPLKLPRGMVIDLDDSGYSYGTSDLGPPPAAPDPYPSMARDDFAARDGIYGNPSSKSFRPVLVMFGPDGSVQQVYHSSFAWVGGVKVLTWGSTKVQSPIFFMIGRATRTGDVNDPTYVTPTPEDELENWQDASNLWLALNSQTGRITVAEVYADVLNPSTSYYTPSNLYVSRALARQAQISMGGR